MARSIDHADAGLHEYAASSIVAHGSIREGVAMDQPSIEAVVKRLERVERENRRWKLGTLFTLLALASLLLMGQARTPSTVEAENFVVKDRRGVAIAFFGAGYDPNSDRGTGMLGFYTYRPDGSASVGTFMSEGNGEG